jgi:DNA-binding MarR family transcriptional regulator
MTDRLDRLERAGLVARRPDPKDCRGKLITLTDPGKRLIDEALSRHVANEERLLLSLTQAGRLLSFVAFTDDHVVAHRCRGARAVHPIKTSAHV